MYQCFLFSVYVCFFPNVHVALSDVGLVQISAFPEGFENLSKLDVLDMSSNHMMYV
jgi:hypothetical protein